MDDEFDAEILTIMDSLTPGVPEVAEDVIAIQSCSQAEDVMAPTASAPSGGGCGVEDYDGMSVCKCQLSML